MMMGFRVMQTRFCNAYYNTGLSEVHVLLVDMLHFEIWQTIMLIAQRLATFPADLFVSYFEHHFLLIGNKMQLNF